ncbi:MAG: CDP-alcohol phosphatidyltransferase family protein [Mycoplasmatales bacterium]
MNQFKKYFITIMTLLRIIGIPFLFMFENQLYLFIYAVILFATDFFDGFLARKWGMTTLSGAIMDLLADKILVIVLLLTAVFDGNVSWLLFSLIAFREVYSMVIRFKALNKNEGLIKASFIGKLKTTLQFVALGMVILNWPNSLIYTFILWIVVGLSYYSFFGYIKESLKVKKWVVF